MQRMHGHVRGARSIQYWPFEISCHNLWARPGSSQFPLQPTSAHQVAADLSSSLQDRRPDGFRPDFCGGVGHPATRPHGSPGVVVQGQLGWPDVDIMRLSQAARLESRELARGAEGASRFSLALETPGTEPGRAVVAAARRKSIKLTRSSSTLNAGELKADARWELSVPASRFSPS